eukprot:GILJ01004230.1.p1 GENE.GILJ01004230.1~~GILJ01004230.1.p1  ORF type:complete len:232 (+),score=37.98 GILJ01004230.1:50-745(+)
MEALFHQVSAYFEAEESRRETIRTHVRSLESITRNMSAALQLAHKPTANVAEICTKVRADFPSLADGFIALGELVSREEYYKYSDHWKFVLQKTVELACFLTWLERRELVSLEECQSLLKQSTIPNLPSASNSFRLDLEDYLVGVTSLSNELARLCINSVIAGRYTVPLEIASFLTDLHAAFRLLNLRNDYLRKRFDSLKYDIKKVEEVVYDIKIRGLLDGEAGQAQPMQQ